MYRFDAEHFQPKYQRLVKHLAKVGVVKKLGKITNFLKRGIQPIYCEENKIRVINSRHIGRHLLNIDDLAKTTEKFWQSSTTAQIQKNDILFYSTGAYIGRTNIYLENQKALASNHTTIIRTKDCNPIYLSVFLNSPLGLMQAEQWASGGGQREVYPNHITKFTIYLPPKPFQQRIADLVQKSYQAQKRAKELLKQAKRKVEELIEE